jgi:hypothetical protein
MMARWSISLAIVTIVLALSASMPKSIAQSNDDDSFKCLPSNFKSDGTKEDIIKKIFARRDCIREQQKARVGKWFCYVTNMVGIQKQSNGTLFAGKIKPEQEKFVATIAEVFPGNDAVRLFTCEHEYGLVDGRWGKNACLANYKIEFSPRITVLGWSEDTYHFDGTFSQFILFGTNNFVLFKNEAAENSYIYHGRCEKINEIEQLEPDSTAMLSHS